LYVLATTGLFTGLFLGSSLISDASGATADHALVVSVDDFNYIDTSNERRTRRVHHPVRCGMSAIFLRIKKGMGAQVIAINHQHIAGAMLQLIPALARMQRVEIGVPVRAQDDRFAVDHELLVAVLQRGLGDPWIAPRPIIVANAVSIALNAQPEAVLFNFAKTSSAPVTAKQN
jgi:hypothetical protein